MAVPPPNISRLQHMLQSAVQSVQWTYSLFWQFCPQQGKLVWVDGYYNGAIKTRKTVQATETSAEEASLQRSQQLRELYDYLSAGESNQAPARRPCAALSPEDLTETEWFYLMCVSFCFPPGVGLPGKAYSKDQYIWLSGASEVDSKVFSRAILAKSARIQTVVCIPLMDGVVELGFTERVQEDPSFIQQIKQYFIDHDNPSPKPLQKPALSEHSTSDPTASSSIRSHYHSPLPAPAIYNADMPPSVANRTADDVEEEEEEEDDDVSSDSEADTGLNCNPVPPGPTHLGQMQPREVMQLEMSEEIRLGSPEDASITHPSEPNQHNQHNRAVVPAMLQQEVPLLISNDLQLPSSENQPLLEELSQEDSHYSQTVSIILQFQSSSTSPSLCSLSHSPNTAFSKWTSNTNHNLAHTEGTSQWLLKYILFTVPYLHAKSQGSHDETNPKTRFRLGKQDELSANHVLAERRRREKLNERFIILRSLVPFVTKMDKASILGDTIEYVKQLRKKIQDLEARIRQMELERVRLVEVAKSGERESGGQKEKRSGNSGEEMRKVRVVEGSGSVGGIGRTKAVESGDKDMLEVSIIENDALVELHCPSKPGLLLDVMLSLRELCVEVTAVQSSLANGFFVAELRAKVKGNTNGKKASIVEVKRAIKQILPQTDPSL